jgi:tetratricopeptide (TPR) repeat protein
LANMESRYCFTKWQSIPALIVLTLAAACAPVQDRVPESPPEAASGAENQAPPPPPTDDDVMYHVFAGEVQGNAGEIENSAADYVAAALQSDDPAIARRATQVAIAAESWQFASMAADRWVQLQPENLDARQTAIQVMLLDGDYVAAEHQMSQVLDLMEHDRDRAWTLIAVQLAGTPDPERARTILQHLIEGHDAVGHADALFAQSQLAARTGDVETAYALAGEALQQAPGRAELNAWAGRLAVNLQKPEVALQRYQKAHELAPDDRTIAMAYVELLKRDGRVDDAQAVLADLPDAPGVRFARVAFALSIEQPEEAEAIYRGFSDASYANELEASFQAARSAEMLGLDQEAIDWYARVDRGENALLAVMRRAVLMAARGDIEAARNLLASTRIRREPEIQLQTYLTESQILIEAGRKEDALEVLSEGLEVMPGNVDVLYGRALLAAELGRIEEAENDLRTILESDPQNAAALNALGYTLADRTERLDEAERLIKAAHQIQPEEPSILDSMGWVAYRQGRLNEALSFLEEAWERDNNPEIAAHLGEVLWSLGRESDAMDAWRLGHERGPDNAVLEETLARHGVEL